MIEAYVPDIPNARWLAIRLLDGDDRVRQALASGEFPEMVNRQRGAVAQFSRKMATQGQ